MSVKERTIVVFPDPLGPLISIPPILGLIALIKIASLSLFNATIAENGKTNRFLSNPCNPPIH
jgi:hypothetical protein